ncbi:cardiolipin synthase [Planctomyces sp. SH-PL62]|uniref:cardiolipin synthase n=1 Tax=Planctomyces sp. SH-PL62 TaxID=1636152 RepID=UPI00083840BA|nr:cardiolipin synthase [Planctomyces sp. SH-PL62]
MHDVLTKAYYWIVAELTTLLGFGLAIVFVAYLLRQKRSPASTLAWLLVIVLAPYVGVPLYILFGGRKMIRMAARKAPVYVGTAQRSSPSIDSDTERLLRSYGVPEARAGNHVAIMETGEESYARLMELIDEARSTIYITTFILGDDEVGRALISALARKAERGVLVRLLLDDVGSWWLRRKRLAPLTRAGGRVAYFMPMLHLPFRGRANLRNHRKLAVADGRWALAGGMNLTSAYMGPLPDHQRWRDLSIVVEGPAVEDLEWLFRSDWKFATGENVPAGRRRAAMGNPEALRPPVQPSSGGTTVQVVASGPDVDGDPLFESLLSLIFFARKRIWIVTPYFVPDDMLVRALVLAVRRGVDVRLIVPWKSNHPIADLAREGYIRELYEAGTEILLYRPTMLHAKAVLFDDRLTIIGSPNMDNRSLFLNYEVALYVFALDRVAEVARWIEQLAAGCTYYEPKRGGTREIAENVLRLFAPLL